MERTDAQWAESLLEKIREKEVEVAKRNADKVPYLTENGKFDDWSGEDKICWWTNGFWAGQLWQLYAAYHDEVFREVAEKIEEKLDRNLMEYMGMDHDSGFKWLLTSVANYKVTGNERSKNRAILAANNLAGRFNLKADLIRAWNDPGTGETAGWAIIDCMMNLPLLYWASDVTKDPRFLHIAKAHADRAMEVFIREDGSSNHIVTFDPNSGEFLKSLGGQGMQEGSSWTRGQSWALYGFSLSYRHTKKTEYLETAKKVAEYIMSQISETGIIPVDFKQPKEVEWEDSTAAVIMACGFLELERQLGACELSERCHKTAMKLLRTIEEHSLCLDMEADHLLENCSAAYHDERHNMTLIYGDYYLTEALLKLCEEELFLW